MEKFRRAAVEVAVAAAVATVFYLFAAALFAVFVRAYAPSDATVTVVGLCLKCLAAAGGAALFVRRERALFKGAAAGAAAELLCALVFGIVGGFRFSLFFPLGLLFSVLFGGIGALCGAKLRKE